MRYFILIPHLRLQNANAMSSPYTIGFPAMTAWLGGVHALQRKLNSIYDGITLDKVAISCHNFDLQVYKGAGDFVNSIIGTANPLYKDGSRPAFIEEARCHLEASLLIECLNFDIDPDDFDAFEEKIKQLVMGMKFAGGDVLAIKNCEVIKFDDYSETNSDFKKILHKLMLGHVLIERRDLVKKTMQEEQKDALDTVLDYVKVTHNASQDANGNVMWKSYRKTTGWIVPIAVGFQGISELGMAKNQRDNKTPHRFAESVVTLGEFIMPYRIKHIDDMLWQYSIDIDNNLYLCQNSTI
ncbi:MAG: type I-F CRISPR-associated protein Csy2 [Proteobacteria bacterium]|jgi:CRISPR-associated protein Csy2|nr:type I-F CRISPR-associated protein Csy2 [Pseudomonadota bacterium]